jgi:hypothetical protein
MQIAYLAHTGGGHPGRNLERTQTMTLAIQIIASAADLPNSGAAADILLAYELAVGVCIGDETEWDDLPLGTGSDLVSFAKSDLYKPEGASYGQIARQWLAYRLARFH